MGQTDWESKNDSLLEISHNNRRRSLRKEEGPRQPPTRGLRGWRNFFCACEGFGGEAAIRTDFAAGSDLPLLLTALLCQKLCSC